MKHEDGPVVQSPGASDRCKFTATRDDRASRIAAELDELLRDAGYECELGVLGDRH